MVASMQPGVTVGQYRVVQRIGEGGMGSVWLAEHLALGRRAALKVLHSELSTRPEIVGRFFNEARAATAISDPGIVQIFDFGQHADGSAYIVMELLEGEALSERIARCGRLPLGDALRIVRQVASSLGAAHDRGIVHRDMKPENIFLARDPEVAGGERAKILDFGIAKLFGDTAGIKTQTAAVMGTPMYMAPEQCRGAGAVDQRADVYSLGCVLFTLLAGSPPFLADGAGELIAMHLREPAPRLSSRAAGVPPAVDRLVAACLAKDPQQRYRSGTELARAIGALTGQGAVAPPSLGAAARSTGAVPPGTTLSGSVMPISAPPGRSISLIAAATCAVVLGGASLMVARVLYEPASKTLHATGSARDIASLPAGLTSISSTQTSRPPAVIPDRAAMARRQLGSMLAAFPGWAASHAGEACPGTADLARVMGDEHAADDPWGHAIAVTCADQPADQIIGAVSAGPDGAFRTADDITSWGLGGEVTRVVAGPRWAPGIPQGSLPRAVGEVPPERPRSRAKPITGGHRSDDDDIPSTR